MRWLGGTVLAGHGLIHLLGVAVLWRLAEPGGLRYADAVPRPGSLAGTIVGTLWLLAAMLLVWSAVLLVAHLRWAAVTVVAAVVSAPVLALMGSAAGAGLAVDAGVLITVLGCTLVVRRSPQVRFR
ncbi:MULTISPECIES: hypothetical protein [unclassified Kitasatospora]|uniref:hypothetical protein n=1 Tax=unclassified Kitasatospora TaxID=2633591 RepID=UPI003401174D